MGFRIIPENQISNDRYAFKSYLQTIAKGSSKTIVILKFYSTRCVHCHTVERFLQENCPVVGTIKDVVLISINVDTFPDIASAFRIRGVPHVMNVTNDGYPDYQVVGANIPLSMRAVVSLEYRYVANNAGSDVSQSLGCTLKRHF